MSSILPINCYFLILPGFLPLDLAGPLQVLLTANDERELYRIKYVGPELSPAMKGGLALQALEPLPELLPANSRLIIPGISKTENFLASELGRETVVWLNRQRQVECLTLATVCSGALIAAKANWLQNKNCTTHHHLLKRLKRIEPSATIEENRLFVRDENVWTSAGISSGIDLMLAFLLRDSDAAYTAEIAREMVIYLRRSGDDPQLSPWLTGRNHLHPKIHQVQDLIGKSPEVNHSIEELAIKVNMSPRNLTRQFRRFTDSSIQHYRETIRLAQAEKLLRETPASVESIAEACGFQSSRSFRRAWNRSHERSPVQFRLASKRLN